MLDVLEAGADDYLPMSVSVTRFVGRIFALMRRINWSESEDDSIVRWGPLNIDTDCHEARVQDHYLALTPTEFRLLYHLARAGGNTMTVKALQKLIWDSDQPLYLGSLRKYVQRLRRKLRDSEAEPGMVEIVAIRGVGYRLVNQGKGAA
jgi:DNA-binding response OmpR family regulator